MVQSGRSFIPGPFGLLGSFPLFKMMNSIANSYEKELNNIIPKSYW